MKTTVVPAPRMRRRRRRWVLPAVAVAAAGALVWSTLGLIEYAQGPVDMEGNHVAYGGGVAPSDESSAVPQTGTDRFDVPSVHLDVPLGAMSAVDGVIEPPGFTSAYWVRNMGVSPTAPETGTVFVAMHSLRNGAVGPGNFLIDVDKATASVGAGQRIRVADTTYTVTRTLEIDKPDIGAASQVWANTPNRLVVITCLQRPQGGPSLQNVVIEATRDPR